MVHRVLWLTMIALLVGSSSVSAQVIGGFDAGRGGIFSLAEGSEFELLRADILAAYPDAQLTGNAVLDSAYLGGVDVLVVGSAFGQASGIVPLSAAEQSALSNFVQNGGCALVLTDNDTLADVALANVSLASVFGVVTNGTLSGNQPVTIELTQHPITNGPQGVVGGYDAVFPGWFSDEGGATVLARLDNAPAQAATALWLGPGDFLQASGTVLLLSDHVFPSEYLLNTIAFQHEQVPALTLPGLLALCAGLVALGVSASPRASVWSH